MVSNIEGKEYNPRHDKSIIVSNPNIYKKLLNEIKTI